MRWSLLAAAPALGCGPAALADRPLTRAGECALVGAGPPPGARRLQAGAGTLTPAGAPRASDARATPSGLAGAVDLYLEGRKTPIRRSLDQTWTAGGPFGPILDQLWTSA